jgi:hypothetical protein
LSARLQSRHPDLAALISQKNESALRPAARAVAELAVERTALDDPRSRAALDTHLSAGPVSAHRAALAALADELDNQAWDLIDDPTQAARYAAAFAQARAAAALQFSFEDDPLTAALETTYEACFAVPDKRELASRIADAL